MHSQEIWGKNMHTLLNRIPRRPPRAIVRQKPIEQDAATEGGNEEGSANHALINHTEEPHEKVAGATEVGDLLGASLQESLMVLADDMATRRERKTHDEVDRELGLSFRDDPDHRWYDHDSAADRLHYDGQIRGDVIKPTPEIGVGTEGYDFGPPTTSCRYSPQDDIWDVPIDGSLPPNTGLLSEKGMVGTSPFNTSPVLVPSGGTTFRPTSRTPAPHPLLQSKANQYRLPGVGMSLENTARIRDLGTVEGKTQRLSMEGYLPRHDGDGGGFAVVRARERLHSFRAARKSVPTDVNVTHRHYNVLPRQLSADQQIVPPSQDQSKLMLVRLKEMRHLLHVT